jgi:starch synthase
VHGNDWPCGFAVAELRARRRYDAFFQPTRTLFSLHNVGYQGLFEPGDLWWLGFGDLPDRNDFLLTRTASALKAGIIAADALSTVSPRYAQEIQTSEQGQGLDWLLRSRSDRLAGITNGVDFDIWNPETDNISQQIIRLTIYPVSENVNSTYCDVLVCLKRQTVRSSQLSRGWLPKGLRFNPSTCRCDCSDRSLLHSPGSGVRRNTKTFYKAGVTVHLGKLVSTRATPVNRWPIRSKRRRHVPDAVTLRTLWSESDVQYAIWNSSIVRATGGLDDTVQQYDAGSGVGTGFKFQPYDAGALLEKNT